MYFLEIKYLFYILLAVTLLVHFIMDILRFKIGNIIDDIDNYSVNNAIFKISFIETAYLEFQDNFTVKRYIHNYNQLLSKKKDSALSKKESAILDTLEKDIQLLKISFLSSVVLDNQELVPQELFSKVERFLFIIKSAQILGFVKIIMSILTFLMFVYLIF